MAKSKVTPTRSHQPLELANYSMECMGQTNQVVFAALTRMPRGDWRRSLSEIADAAFSDAFHGMCAVAVGQKPPVDSEELVVHFIEAMQRVLEDRERSWGAQVEAARRSRRPRRSSGAEVANG